jgi:hypothetical protein
MGTHFYQFARSTKGNLRYWGKIEMKYFDETHFGVLIKDIDLENTVDSFLVDKRRTVKSGKTWLSNHLKN